jgi:catechol 2,3-dioxygenase-like lactoylglutathione lyase family enzyme
LINKLILITVIVRDQEEALDFYCNKLGFEKKHDLPLPSRSREDERWLTVAPKHQKELAIVLRKPHADDNELITSELDLQIGRGTLWTFSTTSMDSTYETLKANGVKFPVPPVKQAYGVEAVFEDLYGNRFALLEVQATD